MTATVPSDQNLDRPVGDTEPIGADEAALIEAIADRVGQRMAEDEIDRDNKGLARHPQPKLAQLRSDFILKELREEQKRRTTNGQVVLVDTQIRRVRDSVDLRLNGLGMLQGLLEDPTVSDVMINGHDELFIKKSNGSKQRLEGRKVASSDDELVRLINSEAQKQGKTWNFSEPELSLALSSPTGRVDRLSAVAFVATRPSVTIRRPNFNIACLQDLVEKKTADQNMANLLRALVLAKKNILVSGGTGAGKTTVLRSLMNEIPPNERLVTIEDPVELGLNYFRDLHPDQVEATARRANSVGKGEVTLRELQRAALRQSPDRVILGEVRGPEAVEMVSAMTQGNAGSMCTIHADSASSALQRLKMYLSMAPEHFTQQAVTTMGTEAVDFVVHVHRFDNGHRKITQIYQITKETSVDFIKADCVYDLHAKVSKLPNAVGLNPLTVEDLQRGAAEKDATIMRIAGSETLMAARNEARGQQR